MAHARSRLGAVMVLVAVALTLVGIPPGSAAAAPNDEEGASGTLREQLDAASKGFVVAQATLAKSKNRQKELTTQLTTVERDLVVKTATLGELANVAYQRGRLGPISALLNSSSPEGFVDRAAALETLAATEDKKLRDLLAAKEEVARAKLAIDGEILEQQKQVQIMAARKKQAENALAAAGAGQSSSGPSSSGGGGTATAAQGPSGSGSCSVKDPTGTGGCVTPRTAHALQQARNAGFTRHTYCWRSGSSGEHPIGRACDFSSAASGFGKVATGGDRTYGNNLANYFIKNASRLGVLYVIWFREIWLPSSGWRAYSGSGSPSAEHTDHVHLSVT
jgi:peptidoglycan DL-endopeptidase CwlO